MSKLPILRSAFLVIAAWGILLLPGEQRVWAQQGPGTRDDSEDLVTDVYCKMTMPKKEMKETWVYQGETYYFCTPECKNEVVNDPKKFTGAMATSRDVNGYRVSFLTKPTKVLGAQSARLILEFLTPEGKTLEAVTGVEAKLEFTFTPPGGAVTRSETPLKMNAYKEAGVYGAKIKSPGKGNCDATFTITFASGKKQTETFKFEMLEGRDEDTGHEYDSKKFDMLVQHHSMRKLGIYWRDIHELLTQDAPDLDTAAKYLDKVEGYSKLLPQFTPHKHSEQKAEFDKLAQEYLAKFPQVKSAFAAKDPSAALKQYLDLEAESCTKCHIKFRWDVVQDLSRFPDLYPPEPK